VSEEPPTQPFPMCAPVKTTLPEPVKIPLPDNFDSWPPCMRRRYLENALGANALAAHRPVSLARSA
jgi:hypothetical protein